MTRQCVGLVDTGIFKAPGTRLLIEFDDGEDDHLIKSILRTSDQAGFGRGWRDVIASALLNELVWGRSLVRLLSISRLVASSLLCYVVSCMGSAWTLAASDAR
jgi:hypothetical protein